jgi:hypothetical protein
MAKSNAQRQAEWRRRRAARAAGQELPQMVTEAVDEAVAALWTCFNRPTPDGDAWAEIDGIESLADYREQRRLSGDLIGTCRMFAGFSGFTPQERSALRRVVSIADALAMKPIAAT